MALYETINFSDALSNLEANRIRSEQERAQRERQRIEEENKNNNGGIGGFFANLTKDLNSAGNAIGTSLAALFSGVNNANTEDNTRNAINESNARQEEIAKKYGYASLDDAYEKGNGPEEMWKELQDTTKEARGKVEKAGEDYKNNWITNQINNTTQSQFGADALRTETNLWRLLNPIASATPLGGAVGGALEGVADSIEGANGTLLDLDARLSGGKIKNTENAQLDAGDMLKRAAIGAGAGAAASAVGNKIGNATSGIGSRLLNNKVITSGIGRGAVGGATAGAVAGGLGSALENGDIIGGALQGAGSGALTGGVAGGLASGARKAGSAVANKLGIADNLAAARQKLMYVPEEKATTASVADVKEPTAKMLGTQDVEDTPVGVDYTKPVDYRGNELKIEKKNPLQKLGRNFQEAGERITNSDLYNALNSKTANEIVKNKTVQELSKLGYNPDDYKEAAKISTTTNEFVDSIVKNSGASIKDPGLVDRIAKPSDGHTLTNKALAKEYKDQVRHTIDTLETNSVPGEYNAADLLNESRRINDLANKYYKQSKDANGGDLAGEKGVLADALMDVKKELRNLASESVDGFGDKYTKSQLTKRLQNLGASQAAIDDMMEAKNIGEFIRKTAKYEAARQMNFEMETNKYKRNAISSDKSNTNLINRVAKDSGLGEAMSVVTKPTGKVVGGTSKLIGKGIEALGNAMAGDGSGLPKINTTPIETRPISADMQNIYNILNTRIGANEGKDAMANAIRAREYNNLESQLAANIADAQNYYEPQIQAAYSQQLNPAQAQLADIANGMNLALAAGDIQSYNTLANLYKTASSIYESQNKDTDKTEKLADIQQKANAAADILDQLEAMNPDFGYTVKDIPLLNLVNMGGNQYANTADSLASQIGYLLSGATVKPDELEKIKDEYVPQPWDSEATRKDKLTRARRVIAQYQNKTA